MGETIRFGGRSAISSAPAAVDKALAVLFRDLAWKYIQQEAEFAPTHSLLDVPPDELRETIAHWAGRVWFHSNQMPSAEASRTFDLMSLKDEFRDYAKTHDATLLDEGLTIEEIWAAEQLFSAKPMVTIVADRHADLLTARMDPTLIQSSDAIVWTLGAMCFELSGILDGQGFNALVTDGKIGHTIYIKGLNGIDFEHPRGTYVRAGWFSFHDPWPARSLLASERDFNGVRVLEDVTRPPMWLISPGDLGKVIVGYLLPIGVLPAFLDIFRTLDIVERIHPGATTPLWIDQYSPDPEQLFSALFALHKGIAPTTAEGLLGLGRTRLLMTNLVGALECFEGAFNLGLPGAAQSAATFLIAAGHESLAKKWAGRRS